MPIGGIGTGTVSLGGRADLRDWEIMNRPAKGFTPGNAFFAISVDGERRALEGPLDPADFDGGFGMTVPNHGLPRFREARFDAAYPLGQVSLTDPDVPVKAHLQAFNPMVPSDADASGIPIAVLRWTVSNSSSKDHEVAVCFSLPNFVGHDGKSGEAKDNSNHLKTSDGLSGVLLSSDGVDKGSEQWGTIALATSSTSGEVTHRTAWAELSWGDSLLDFWDDLADGRLEERAKGGTPMPIASVCQKQTVPAGQSREFAFLIGWHFPNRKAWSPDDVVGNYYTTRYTDAWDVLADTAPRLPELEQRTVRFVRAFLDSDLPEEIKEAALFTSSTLRTQTSFRTADGNFFGWEGCGDHDGCCDGSCTHVWNYEQATAHLFGDLARSMRHVEFAHATRENGLMSFRVHLPLGKRASEWTAAAADGQMGCLMKLHRDWKLSGDDAMLKELWPHAKKALEFAWQPGGWDGNRDGLMEGCQHNTMDVEYYGPNPEMGSWYLGALRSCEEMAKAVGDEAFATECRRIYESGRAGMDSQLFNGEYYEHKILPAKQEPPEGLRVSEAGYEKPVLQLGPGCLADQLVGATMARVSGMGALLDESHTKTTLNSLMKYNYRERMFGHFNHLRTYALQDEPGMLIAFYPSDKERPERPFPYCNEVWTGLEYTAAALMLYEGLSKEGLKVVRAARMRHDGQRRNPFDESECGHHYARAMASWGCVLGWHGFSYDAKAGRMSFLRAPGKRSFWSTGDSYGTVEISGGKALVECIEGKARVRELAVGDRVYQASGESLLTTGAAVECV